MNYVYLVLGALAGYLLKVWNLFLYDVRLEPSLASRFYNNLRRQKVWEFVFSDSYITQPLQLPPVEAALVWHGLPFVLSICERDLRAGHRAKEHVCNLTTLRFLRRRLLRIIGGILGEDEEKKGIKVYVGMDGWGFVQCNEICKERFAQRRLVLDEDLQERVYDQVDQFAAGARSRLGILLYGPPGNGKTSLIKAVACKYDYDIYVLTFKAEMTNHDLIGLFLELPRTKRIIVVLEDFDSVFNRREPLYADCKFSFDCLLNLIDGLYRYVSTENTCS